LIIVQMFYKDSIRRRKAASSPDILSGVSAAKNL
jgi:hypothetical protein